MKLSVTTKKGILEVICLLYVLLFIYAAVSKLLDFKNFQVQLGQSPLLSAFAWWVSGLVPITELGIVVLLAIPRLRTLGLFSSLILMTMFTTYIFIVLHFSAFIPCSCGGILEKMSWNKHLVFNFVFVILAVLALLCQNQVNIGNKIVQPKRLLIRSILISIVASVGFVTILFLSSEDVMHRKNPFVRRYIRRSIELVHSVDLKFNSYYFSGYTQGNMYLGNYTDPLRMLSIDSSFKSLKRVEIDFKNRNLPFRLVKVLVRGNYFFLTDGSVPRIFRGRIDNWKITEEIKGVSNFTQVEPIDSTSIVFRNNKGEGAAHILGTFNSDRSPKEKYLPTLLQKQIDGIFDTDGMLLFNAELGRIVYVYFYRNEIIVADKNGTLHQRQRTIDTISRATIKVANLKESTQRKMAAPAAVVNANTTTKNNLLFVESKVPGLYEDKAMWKQDAIIDVYNLKNNTYVLSFPIFGVQKNKLQSLFVTSTHLYVIIGTELKIYALKDSLKKEMINRM